MGTSRSTFSFPDLAPHSQFLYHSGNIYIGQDVNKVQSLGLIVYKLYASGCVSPTPNISFTHIEEYIEFFFFLQDSARVLNSQPLASTAQQTKICFSNYYTM